MKRSRKVTSRIAVRYMAKWEHLVILLRTLLVKNFFQKSNSLSNLLYLFVCLVLCCCIASYKLAKCDEKMRGGAGVG